MRGGWVGEWEQQEGSSLDAYQLRAAKALLARRLALVQVGAIQREGRVIEEGGAG
jgi:hypothetical protein